MIDKKFKLWITEKNRLFANIYKYDDNGNVIEFEVESKGFAGKGPLYFSEEDVKKYIQELDVISQNFKGECILNDIESDYFLKLYYESTELRLKGKIGDYSDHSLTFDFKVDQTIIKLLIEVLNTIK